eukprot:4308251-Pyramimonas_sp.AAC.1
MPEPQGGPQTFGRIFGEPARFEQMPGSPSHGMHGPKGMAPVATTPVQSPFGTPGRSATNGTLMGRIAAARADHGTALLGMMPPGAPSSLRGDPPGTPARHRPLADQNIATGVPDDYRTR